MQNRGWEIEKSTTGNAWQKIGFVEGKSTTSGTNNYSFIDAGPLTTPTRYRLKQLDKDGTARYSSIITIKPVTNTINSSSVFPNPVKDIVTVAFTLAHPSTTRLDLYNATGLFLRNIMTGRAVAGTHSMNVNTALLPAGQYYFKLAVDNFNSSIAFIKTH